MSIDFVKVSLPSRCIPYGDIDPNSIYVRPFRGEDEQLIAEMNPTNAKKNYIKVLSNVVKGVAPEKLTSGDASFLMVWEAINSYSNKYPVRLTCQVCAQNIDIEFDLGTLENIFLPEDYREPYEEEISTGKIQLRLITTQDELDIVEFQKNEEFSYLYSYAVSIVHDKLDSLAKVKMLEGMTTKDLNVIKKFHQKFDHGPDFNTSYECPKCGGGGAIFLPFRIERVLFS
jgi:hypothetical protein